MRTNLFIFIAIISLFILSSTSSPIRSRKQVNNYKLEMPYARGNAMGHFHHDEGHGHSVSFCIIYICMHVK